jgi:hypothetical protein
MFQKTRLSDKNSLGIINDSYLYIMIRLTKIIEDLTKPQVKESVDPSLLILIDNVITDTNVLVVNNLKMIKDILSKEPIDKAKLDVALSNYKRYFNRDNGGTPEVIRGMTMQNKLDELAK